MTLDQLSQYLTWAIYIVIFCIAAVKAVRRPTRANIDIALLFAAPALTIGLSTVVSLKLIETGALTTTISTALVLAWAYMLLRLADDFSVVPTWLSWSAPVLLAIFVVTTFLIPAPGPLWFSTAEVLYIICIFTYTAVLFIRDSTHASGVTMRRLRAVALGSIALTVLFVIADALAFFPGASSSTGWILDLTEIASGILYFIGFTTPGILRRAWQEPELRAFLGRAASLPRLPNTGAIIVELERGAASSVGAPGASIGLWDETTNRLRFKMRDENFESDPNISLIGRVFLTQKPLFSDNTVRDNPATAEMSRSHDTLALLAAPITAGEKRLGVLAVYALRPSIFAEEDLELVRLLADQAAVVLESRALIDEAARVQAREEVTRLKEDFLSAAAHDLKTPLTILVMQAEMLERRAQRSPGTPADITSLQKLKKEAYRLKDLVLELLDAARAEQGRLVGEFEQVDLAALANDACERHSTPRHPCNVQATGPVTGMYDPNRMIQLLENLVENAIKYSPNGGPVSIRLWQETRDEQQATAGKSLTLQNDSSSNFPSPQSQTWNHITVTDYGIGIPKEDMPNIFQRFHRGSNVDDRHFAGMGLGLFICQGIVEQHGGRIWVESPATTQNDGSRNGHYSGETGKTGKTGQMADTGSGTENLSTGRADSDNSNGGIINYEHTRHNPGTTFHVALPATPPAVQAEPAQVGTAQGR